MKPLLTLIDFQQAFLLTPGIEPPVAFVVDRAASLLKACRQLQIPVAHIRTATPPGSDHPAPRLKKGSGWKPQIDSLEYQPPVPLAAQPDECVIHKSGYRGLSTGEVASLVDRFNVDTLIMMGVYLHACVRQAALDAREAGWKVWVAEDAVASDDPLHAAVTRHYLEARSVRFAPVDTLCGMIASSAPVPDFKTRSTVVDAAVRRAVRWAPVYRTWECPARLDLVRTLMDRLARSATTLRPADHRRTGETDPIQRG